MTELKSVLAHLYALRAHIDAVILAAEGAAVASPQTTNQPTSEPGRCRQCGAGPEYIEDRSTLDGTKRDRCTRCGYEWVRFTPESVAP